MSSVRAILTPTEASPYGYYFRDKWAPIRIAQGKWRGNLIVKDIHTELVEVLRELDWSP